MSRAVERLELNLFPLTMEGWASEYDLQEYVGGHEFYLHKYKGDQWAPRRKCRIKIEFIDDQPTTQP